MAVLTGFDIATELSAQLENDQWAFQQCARVHRLQSCSIKPNETPPVCFTPFCFCRAALCAANAAIAGQCGIAVVAYDLQGPAHPPGIVDARGTFGRNRGQRIESGWLRSDGAGREIRQARGYLLWRRGGDEKW